MGRGREAPGRPRRLRPLARLGALVDPLGLFRQSALVTNDARDEAALRAAARLSAVAEELLAEGTATEGREPQLDPQVVSRALAAKAWQRRDDLQEVSRRIAVEALDQGATRLAAAAVGRVP